MAPWLYDRNSCFLAGNVHSINEEREAEKESGSLGKVLNKQHVQRVSKKLLFVQQKEGAARIDGFQEQLNFERNWDDRFFCFTFFGLWCGVTKYWGWMYTPYWQDLLSALLLGYQECIVNKCFETCHQCEEPFHWLGNTVIYNSQSEVLAMTSDAIICILWVP